MFKSKFLLKRNVCFIFVFTKINLIYSSLKPSVLFETPHIIIILWKFFILGIMFALGDLIAQNFVEKRKPDKIDWLRTVRYASIGCALGPTLTLWYKILDRFGTQNKISIITKKILVDQLIASPIITGSVMIMSRVFSGDEWPQIQKKLEDNYVHVLLTSYTVNTICTIFVH